MKHSVFVYSSFPRHSLVTALSIALACSLSACGGGGSNVRSAPPVAPTDPCVTNPNAPGCQTDPPETTPTYDWPYANALVPTHVMQAHDAGFTGKGVKVAVMDSGIDPSLPDFKGRDFTFHSFLGDDDSKPFDSSGHGSIMAGLIAGSAAGDFTGGIAPDADLYIGKICTSATQCALSEHDANFFFDKGVRLFNYSVGGSTTNGGLGLDPNNLATYSRAFQSLIDGGALFVWAAGNGGVGTLDEAAAVPHYIPELGKGWLVAVNVAVDHDTGEITGLYSGTSGGNFTGSSDCGIAADWCLAAPGYNYTPTPADSVYKDGMSAGTSDSTAIITGVAALVSGAYPWMGGHNIQQTLLTTATHLEDTSKGVSAEYKDGNVYVPNSVYGWGLVDAERAVRGPGQFVGQFDANVGDYHSAFDNVISGSGSLVLTGADGSLEFTADNTFTGSTTINGATLALSGSLTSSVTVNAGSLAGDGAVHANVNNVAGTVASTNTTADKGLTIDGNYTAGAGSTTSVALGHALTVGETAALDGTLSITPSEETYAPKTTETLIAAGTVMGTFATTDDSALPYYTATIAYTGTTVDATLTRKDVSQSSSRAYPVQAATAQGLEGALKQADQWSATDYVGHKTFLDTAARFLSVQSQAQADASVSSLSGEIHGTVNAIEAASSAQIDHAVALRQNGMGEQSRSAFWLQGLAGDGGVSQTGFASASFNTNGFLGGFDIPLTNALSGGVLGGQARTHTRSDAVTGRVDERDTFAGIYALYRFDNDAYLAGRASWTHANFDTHRTALIGADAYRVNAVRTDGVGRVTLEAGKRFGALTPYIAATGLRINQQAFTETGASGFGLTADSQRHSATMADVGVRWNQAFAWAGGVGSLTAYVDYQHVLSGSNLDFTGAFTGAPDATYVVVSQSLPRDMGKAGVTFNNRVSQQWDWFFDLNAQGASGRYHAFGVNAGLRFTF